MCYLELMTAEYQMTLPYIWRVLPVVVGFALMEAREERLTGDVMGFVSRAGIQARQDARRRLQSQYRVIEPEPVTEPQPTSP